MRNRVVVVVETVIKISAFIDSRTVDGKRIIAGAGIAAKTGKLGILIDNIGTVGGKIEI